MTWYGVNYVFGSGLHSYGGGAGCQHEVGIGISLNWLFAAAAGRYLTETGRKGIAAPAIMELADFH